MWQDNPWKIHRSQVAVDGIQRNVSLTNCRQTQGILKMSGPSLSNIYMDKFPEKKEKN